MGDLDDFFAKKDKKKGKSKTKVIAANLFDEIKKETEAKQEKLKKKQQLESNEQAPHVLKKTKEDDDWEDFEDPSSLNLEGLRVVNLADRPANQESGRGGADGGESGSGQDGDATVDEGPWKRKAAAAEAAASAAASAASPTAEAASTEAGSEASSAAPAAPTATSDASDSQAAASGGEGAAPARTKYVPPNRRGAAAPVTAAAAVSGRPATDLFQARPLPRSTGRRDKNAPNINDVSEFPTLAPGSVGGAGGSAGADDDEAESRSRAEDNRPFESVREQGSRSGRGYAPHPQTSGGGGSGGGQAKPEAVSVSNRWNALDEDAAS